MYTCIAWKSKRRGGFEKPLAEEIARLDVDIEALRQVDRFCPWPIRLTIATAMTTDIVRLLVFITCMSRTNQLRMKQVLDAHELVLIDPRTCTELIY